MADTVSLLNRFASITGKHVIKKKKVIAVKVCPLSSSPCHELLTIEDMLIVNAIILLIRLLLLVY